jgi:hypothetical protein
MAYHDDDEERSGLTLSDIGSALKGEDQAAFRGLMEKALRALDEDNDGIITQLKAENAALRRQHDTDQDLIAHTGRALDETRVMAGNRAQVIADLRAKLAATDGERAAALIAENESLKKTLAIQRQRLATYASISGISEAALIHGKYEAADATGTSH